MQNDLKRVRHEAESLRQNAWHQVGSMTRAIQELVKASPTPTDWLQETIAAEKTVATAVADMKRAAEQLAEWLCGRHQSLQAYKNRSISDISLSASRNSRSHPV